METIAQKLFRRYKGQELLEKCESSKIDADRCKDGGHVVFVFSDGSKLRLIVSKL